MYQVNTIIYLLSLLTYFHNRFGQTANCSCSLQVWQVSNRPILSHISLYKLHYNDKLYQTRDCSGWNARETVYVSGA